MPHLTFKNIKKDCVKKISKNILGTLSEAIDCPKDWITFSHTENSSFFNGEEVTELVFVEVKWFDRSEEVKSKVVEIIKRELIKDNIEDIIIIFTILEVDNYFEN